MKIKRNFCAKKLFDMDYCDLDDSKTMELYSSIIQNLNGPGWGLYNVLLNYEALCSEGFSIICWLIHDHFPFHQPEFQKQAEKTCYS